jgi:hypothetical protein
MASTPDRPAIAGSASSSGVDEIRKSPNPGAPGTEGLWPALPIEAHGIHDALDTGDGSDNGTIIVDVGLDRVGPNVGEER